MRPQLLILGAACVAGLAPGKSQRAAAAARRAAPVDDAEVVVSPRMLGLALQLDDGTRKVHSVAENTQFVTGFFRGLAEKDSFSRLTTSFYYVYEAMEAAIDATPCAAVRAMDFAPLRRMAPLERDMAFFYGEDWRNKLPRPSAATRKYVDRINEVAASDKPELLLGHVYSRYLGDLFGGQMMMGMATRSLKLERGDDGGLAFYTFTGIGDTRGFIDEWYTALNALDLTAEMKEEVVEEANVVFRLNIEVFNELEGNPARAAAMLAIQYAREKIASLFAKDPKP